MAKARFTTPVMRMVQGSVDEPQTKDQQGNLRVVKTGPNAGQPNPQYFVAGAIAKNDPAWPAMWAALVNQAVQDFPNYFPQGAAPVIAAGGPQTGPGGVLVMATQGVIAHPQFSFKVMDGDGVDSNGKSNASKEGFAGHWVVRFASSYPPRCFHAGRYGAHEQIQEKNAIKRGYFIRVSGSVEGNGNAQRPGLYVNLDMVELSAYGAEIVSGPDAADAFGSAPAALPAGATAAPQTPAAAAPAPVTQAPPVAPTPAAAAPVQPYTGFMGNAAQPAASPSPTPAPSAAVATPSPTNVTPPPPPPAPVAGPVMLPAAGGATYEQMIQAGWTDETLRAHGMMA